jgi:hypothetical protein
MALLTNLMFKIQEAHGGFAVVKPIVEFFAEELVRTRQTSVSRFTLLLQNYVLLREWQSTDFMTLRLVSTLSLRSPGPGETPQQRIERTECCWCTGSHGGGQRRCPWKFLKLSKADSQIKADAVEDLLENNSRLTRSEAVAQVKASC